MLRNTLLFSDICIIFFSRRLAQHAFTSSEECKLTSTRRFLSIGFLELADKKKECSVCSFEDVNLDANIHPFIYLLNCLNKHGI